MSGSYTELNQQQNSHGFIGLSNGVGIEYGTTPKESFKADTTCGGYAATISLAYIKSYYFAVATPIYPGGFPKVAIKSRTATTVTLISDVYVNGLYVSWMVIGTKK